MGKEVGKISKVEGNWMTVQLRTGEQCEVCAAKSACSFGGPKSKYRFIHIPVVQGFQEGNLVYLEYPEKSKIIAALIVFLLPILMILAGYAIANQISQIPNSGVFGALGGFFLSIGVLYMMNKLLSKTGYFLPRIIGRVRADSQQNANAFFRESGF